jgi:hypothetical protein
MLVEDLSEDAPLSELPSEPVAPAPEPEVGTFTLFDLKHRQCRWPVAEVPGTNGHLFCGDTAAPSHPYCLYHRAIARGTVPRRGSSGGAAITQSFEQGGEIPKGAGAGPGRRPAG